MVVSAPKWACADGGGNNIICSVGTSPIHCDWDWQLGSKVGSMGWWCVDGCIIAKMTMPSFCMAWAACLCACVIGGGGCRLRCRDGQHPVVCLIGL